MKPPPAATAARVERMTARLRERGARLTPQRLAIVDLLAVSEGHPTAEQVHTRMLEQFPRASLATVYKTLTLLKQDGEVMELGFSDLGNRYDGARPEPHPHCLCTRCGAIVDPHGLDLEPLLRQAMADTGFQISSHRLDFYGLCPVCQATGPHGEDAA